MRTDRVQVIAGSLWLSMQIEKDRKEALCIYRCRPVATDRDGVCAPLVGYHPKPGG